MSNENAELIRRAYQAYANGDLATMLELIDSDLEWTYLDPTLEHPHPAGPRPTARTHGGGKRWLDAKLLLAHGISAPRSALTSNHTAG
jgi:ketosteroid isomerase-like protein